MKRFLLVASLLCVSSVTFAMDFGLMVNDLRTKQRVIRQVVGDNFIISIYQGYHTTIKEECIKSSTYEGCRSIIKEKFVSADSAAPAVFYMCTIRGKESGESDIMGGFIFAVKYAAENHDDAYLVAAEASANAGNSINSPEFLTPYKLLFLEAEELLRSCGCKTVHLSPSLRHFETAWFFYGLGFDPSHNNKAL